MVTKIITGKSLRSIMLYNENKVKEQKAKIVVANKFGIDIEKLNVASKLKRFELLTFFKPNVKTNALHIMLNFDNSDIFEAGKLQSIAVEYMDRIGFGDQPYLVYQHHDTAHPHLHVVTTNITADSQRIDMHGIGRTLSEDARKELEITYGLIKAEGRERSGILQTAPIDLVKAVYGKAATKRTITNVVWAVIRDYKYTSLAEFNAALGQFGVVADRGKEGTKMFENRGLVYSLIDVDGKRIGVPFKASQLSGRPLLDVVEKKFGRSGEIRQTYRESVSQRIDRVMNKYNLLTKHTFDRELAANKIGVVYRINPEGRCYGVTFVDHRTKCVFNGSDLGKAYSAKSLTESFTTRDEPKTYLGAAISSAHANAPHHDQVSKSTPQNQGLLDMVLLKNHNEELPSNLKPKKKRKKGRSNSRDLNR